MTVNIIPPRWRSEIDTFIDQGLTLEEIGKLNNCTRENIRQYINLSGQHDYFLQRREIKKELEREKKKELNLEAAVTQNKLHCKLISILQDRLYQKVQEQSWAYKKAIEYHLSRKQINDICISLPRLITLFETYEEAQKNNQRMSLDDFQKATGISRLTVINIFHKTHVEPMYKAKGHHSRSTESKIPIAAEHKMMHKERIRLESAITLDPTKKQQELISIFKGGLYQKAKEQGWAYEKAVEYHLSRKQISTTGPAKAVPLASLITLFETYEEAQKNNQRMSLQDFQNETGINWNTINIIFRKTQVEPMYGANPHNLLSSENKERVKKAITLDLSISDLAYFSGIPYMQIYSLCLPKRQKKSSLFCVGGTKEQRHLTYRLASQIYEAHDLDFEENDITNLFNTHIKITTYALEQRAIIEPKIIHALQTIYPEHNIDKPYLQK